jgi:putative FmdB family regulatory protein
MPTYEYRCPDGHEFEQFVRKISQAASELPCPVCGKPAARRISAGAGLVFKGSGFYITDYGKDGKKDERDKAEKLKSAAAKSEASTKSDGAAKSDAASASKSDSSGSESGKSDTSKSDASRSASSRGDGSKPASGKGDSTQKDSAAKRDAKTPAPSNAPKGDDKK